MAGKYQFDPLKRKSTFDDMFGAGSYDSGISRAKEIGAGIGAAKLMEQKRKEREAEEAAQARLLEAAAKEAAKKERERQKKKDADKKAGKKMNKNAQQVEDKKRQIEKSGGNSEKATALDKALNLDPDNGFFGNTFDILGRGANAVMNIAKYEEEVKNGKHGKQLQDNRKKSIFETGIGPKMNIVEQQAIEAWKGLSGKEKTHGTDVLKEAGMKKGFGRSAAGFGLEVATDPLNLLGAPIAKGVGLAAKGIGKGLKYIPGVEKAADATADTLGSMFSRKRTMSRTLEGGRSEDLINTDRTLRDTQNSMSEDALDTVAKAGLQGGRGSGLKTGEYMERGLRQPGPLDITSAPNVLDPVAALRAMPKPGVNTLDPLGRMRDITADTTTSFNRSGTRQVDAGEMGTWGDKISDKEVKQWLKDNNLPGGDKAGRVSKFNKELYKAENQQQLAAVHSTRTNMTQILKSTTNSNKATQELMQEPLVRQNVKKAAETLVSGNKAITDFAKTNDIDLDQIEFYLAHFATKEAQKWLKENGDSVSSGASMVGGNSAAVTRKIKDGVKNANIKMKKPTNIDEFFHTDAFTASAGGMQRAINFVMAEASKKKVLDMPDFAKPIANTAKARKGNVHMDVGGQRYELTRGAADVIKNFDNVMADDEGIKTFVKGFDKLQNLWKKSALFSAGFHMRSIAGNSWNMHVAGMNAAEATAKQITTMGYLRELRAVRTGRKSYDPLKDLQPLAKKYGGTGKSPTETLGGAMNPAARNLDPDDWYDDIARGMDEFNAAEAGTPIPNATVKGKKMTIEDAFDEMIDKGQKYRSNMPDAKFKELLDAADNLTQDEYVDWLKTNHPELHALDYGDARKYMRQANKAAKGKSSSRPASSSGPSTVGSKKAKTVKQAKVPAKIIDQYDDFIKSGLRNTGSGADFMHDADNAMKEVRFRQKGTLGKAVHEFAEIGKADGLGGKLKQAGNAAFDSSKRLGDEIDEVARFTLFRSMMDKGMTSKQAADKVREVLFDYTDLTQFEKRYAKRAAPFYTFMRKNAEFQLKAFSKHPEKYSHLNMAVENAKDGSDLDGRETDVVPKYLRDSFAMPLGGMNKMLNLALPASDLNRLEDPGKMALDSLSPLAKVPLEMMTGRRFLDGKPIQEFEGQHGQLMGKTIGNGLGLDGKQWEYLASNLLSPVRNISGAKQAQAQGGSPTETIMKAMGGEVAKPYNVDDLQNSADFRESQRLTGIINRMKKQEGKTVLTKNDMKKQGIPVDEEQDQQHAFLKAHGYTGKQRDMLLALKNKVYNGNAETADKVRQVLEQMGIDPDVTDMITKDYLDY